MITPAQIYWITRLDSIHTALCPIFIICIVVVILVFFINGVALERPAPKKQWLPFAFIFGIALAIDAFTPTTKEMAAIILIPRVVNGVAGNKALRELPANVLDLANAWLEDLKPKKEKVK